MRIKIELTLFPKVKALKNLLKQIENLYEKAKKKIYS